MLKERTFIIAVHPDGSYTVKTGNETKGEVCIDQMQHLQNIIGGTMIEEGYTDNYYLDEDDPIDIHTILGE